MRNTFINTLCELAEVNQDVFLVCGDLGFSVLEPFATRFPDRFLNAGIAEQNMTAVAAGLALEGYNVFTYSIGNFPTLRCLEQIRYDVAYHQANVKIIAVGAGYAYGPQGVSHHTTEDIAALRSIPGMIIGSPADPTEASLMAHFMSNYQGPGYVRLNKTGEPSIYDNESRPIIQPGRFSPIREGNNTLVLSTGAITHSILTELQNLNLNWALSSAPFVGNYDRKMLLELCETYPNIVTVEEHQSNGGFGSSVVEAISDLYAARELATMPRVRRIAIPNKFIGTSGTQEYLRLEAGLTLTKL